HPRAAAQPARDARRRAGGGAAGARDGGPAMSAATETPLGLERLQQRALVVGMVALGACAAGGLANPADFFRAYLIGYLYCLGIALGSLVILMLHYLSGGAWGLVVRRRLEDAPHDQAPRASSRRRRARCRFWRSSSCRSGS